MKINRKLTLQVICTIMTGSCFFGGGQVSAEVYPPEPSDNIIVVKKSEDHASSFDYWINVSDTEARTDWDIYYVPIYGGYISNGNGDVSGNIVTVKNAEVSAVYGGSLGGNRDVSGDASGDVSGNIVMVINSTAADVYGGILTGAGNVTGNTVLVTDSEVSNVYGGSMCPTRNGAEVRAGTVVVKNSKVLNDVVGGCVTMSGMFAPPSGVKVNDNIVEVINSTVNGKVIGGDVLFDSGRESGNMVNIYGGSHTGDVYPGRSRSVLNLGNQSVSVGNTVGTIYLSKDFKGRECSINELNVWSVGNRAGALEGDRQDINFYIPAAAKDGNAMLTVNGTANVRGSTIRAAMMQGSSLSEGDVVCLIKADTLNIDDTTDFGKLQGTVGISYDYEFDIYQDGNTIVVPILDPVPQLNVSSVSVQPLKPQTKIVTETRAVGLAILGSGHDLIVGKGFESAKAAAEAADIAAGRQTGYTPFAALGGNEMRYNTGSHVDVNGWGINVGLARKLKYNSGTLMVTPLLEYGRGNYASYLDDGTDSHGDGNSQFFGLGCMVRKDNNNGIYSEGSLRFGRMRSTFNGTVDGIYTDYKTESSYFALHTGVGKIFKQKGSNWDVYSRFFWARQGGDTAHLFSGEDCRFDSVSSSRIRIGTGWTKDLGKASAFYVGEAYEYEFNGKARAGWNGDSTPSPSLKGSSGLLKLGWQSKATKDNPVSIDLGVTGWAGKQRGLQFNAGFNW